MKKFSILFDLGGVLIENRTFEELPKLISGCSDIDLKRQWLESLAVREFELGKCNPKDFSERFVSEWNLAVKPDEFVAKFATWPTGFMSGAEDLIANLRQRHQVACLSNSNEIHWKRFDGFTRYFDVALSSHMLGQIKPDFEAFSAAIAHLETKPEEVYFFDDSPVCVEAARRMNINAFLAASPEDCKAVLIKEGLYAV